MVKGSGEGGTDGDARDAAMWGRSLPAYWEYSSAHETTH